jgi:2-polyprenyl-3-methyl-5-hydroxy-6-metoxy-1,4-benzoquinol methylase
MFTPVERCWICGGSALARFHQCRLDFREYAKQDPELDAYSDYQVWLMRCAACGFGQPEQVPTLPRFFDRMYDQRWADDWIAQEFDGRGKDFIFRGILRTLNGRVPRPARLLDVGAHAGRFISLAQQEGWIAEGVELNPRTASYAADRTGAPVHRVNAHALVAEDRRYAAVTLTDVLEHVPEPMQLLGILAGLMEPGGWIAIKVPCGPSQLLKEQALSVLTAHRVSVAENLVHVSHFSPRSLKLALERAGLVRVELRAGAPELLSLRPPGVRHAFSNALRLAVYATGRLPGAVHTPLALNLQAFAMKPKSPKSQV